MALPTLQEIAYWKLALPESEFKISGTTVLAENLSNDQITDLINQRTAKPAPRIDLFDKRCWSLMNQISLVRSKMGFNGTKKSVDGLTERVWAWGDGYWDKGWITGTRFATAAEVYVKNTQKTENDLKNWILLNTTDTRTYSSPTLKVAGDKTMTESFIERAVSRAGTTYSLGVPRKNPTDPNEVLFDCSSLVYWAADQAGYKPPKPGPGWGDKNTVSILKLCQDNNSMVSVGEGNRIPRGALLFRIATPDQQKNGIINHVAISLGNNETMEAIGSNKIKKALATGDKRGNPWTHAAFLPGMSTQGNSKENSYLDQWLNNAYFQK